jgi:hypothetical protein
MYIGVPRRGKEWESTQGLDTPRFERADERIERPRRRQAAAVAEREARSAEISRELVV